MSRADGGECHPPPRSDLSTEARSATLPEDIVRLDRQMKTLRRGIDRLIDCYAGGLIDKAEFEPRIAGLKSRMSQLHKQQQTVIETANAERELSLVISRLQDFSAKVSHGLDGLDWLGMREIIRTVVRRVEIDHDNIEIVFRVPPPEGPPTAGSQIPTSDSRQHCTGVYASLFRSSIPTTRRFPHNSSWSSLDDAWSGLVRLRWLKTPSV